MKIKFKKMREGAIIPTFGNDDATNAGIDLYAWSPRKILIIDPGESKIIDTGVAWEPVGGCKYAMIIQSRSGMAFKQGLEASNAGVVDHSYRGSIMVKIYNNSKVEQVIEHGDRIAQGVVHLLPFVDAIEEADTLTDTIRGPDGFGSSGR